MCWFHRFSTVTACGADKVFGHDLPENKACKFVLDAVLKMMDATGGKAILINLIPSFYSRKACWLTVRR